jgi:hypothetical protein
MDFTADELFDVRVLEKLALAQDYVPLTKRQAEIWSLIHVNDDWYQLPLMLMARGVYLGSPPASLVGLNMDYENFTEVGADSVYELYESGCFIEFPEWDAFEFWKRG